MNLNKVAIIQLDARPSSSLQWGEVKPQVLKEIASGKTVLWHLNFGLFSGLPKPLENQEQFLTLSLAIDHFKEAVWKEYHRFSRGVLLYKGSSDVQLPIDLSSFNGISKGLQARNVCANYLTQLSAAIPDEIQPYILFDQAAQDSLLHILAGDPDLYGRIVPLYANEEGYACEEERETAVLMPPIDEMREEVLRPFQKILEILPQPYKKIPESRLISCWHGLDHLIYSESALSAHGRRQLNGFIAAGGEAIELNLVQNM
ncbi:MAG: hypothetical protein ACK5MA_11425 [Parachlamydiaceae bacterium]